MSDLQTLALLSGSPAINAGTCGGAPTDAVIAFSEMFECSDEQTGRLEPRVVRAVQRAARGGV